MKRINFNSWASWEKTYSYSRAVKKGNYIFVSGTTAVDNDWNIHSHGNIAEQTDFIINKIEKTLKKLNSRLSDIVRVRIFIVNIELWKEAGKVFSAKFEGINPAATLVEVNGLIDQDLLIEIEVDAISEN